MKAVQLFSKEYLKQAENISADDCVRFLEDFRLIHEDQGKSKLISIKIPEQLLTVFRIKCRLYNVPYQSQIKKLMTAWLKTDSLPKNADTPSIMT